MGKKPQMHVTIGLSGNFDYIVHIVNCALFPIFATLWKKKMQHRTHNGRRIFVMSFVSPQPQKFVANGYDVFLLSNPKATKSADFIIRKRNCLYYVEGKTSSGGGALTVRLSDGAKQAERIAINLTNIPKIKRLAEIIKNTFIENYNLRELFIFKGSTLIEIDRFMVDSKDFQTKIFKEFSRKK